MTLGQIMTLALRQLDEDPEDISEWDDMLRVYANIGYRIAMEEYVKPRDTRRFKTDKKGEAYIDGDVQRVVEIRREMGAGRIQRNVIHDISPSGDAVITPYPNAQMSMICEIRPQEMEQETDEPQHLPESAHPALADYICYRHLLNGNMAKQSRAQQYLQSFYQAMQRLRPQGMGSVRGYTNLYAATSIRNVR